MKLTYLNADGTNVTGLDRFGRIADQLWETYGSNPTVRDEYTYQYDRAGNVHSKTNVTKSDHLLDEVYGYSDLDQLTSVKDYLYNDKQSWTLDSLGNWLSFNNGTATDEKTFNAANETISTDTQVSSRRNTTRRATPSRPPSRRRHNGLELRLRRMEPPGFGHVRHDHRPVSIRRRRPADRADRRRGGRARLLFRPADHSGLQLQRQRRDFQGGYQYVWSPLYVDTPVVRDTYNGSGDEVAQLYYTTDANHNVTAVMNSSGWSKNVTLTRPIGK